MVKRVILIGLVVVLMLVSLPVATASAAPIGDDPNPGQGKNSYPRVEKAFQRVKGWYDKQGEFIERSEDYISKVETLIGKAEERGLDASSVRVALEAFASSIPSVKAAHDRAGAIISSHKGFDGNGKVTDIELAAQTVNDAAAALKEGRDAHLGKGKALREAIRAFIRANKPQRPAGGGEALPPVPTER